MTDKTPIGEIRLKDVRLSFAQIFEPKKFGAQDDSKPRYSCSFLFAKDTPSGIQNEKLVRETIKAVATEKWGKNMPKLKENMFCFRNGDNEDWDGYAGHWYVSAARPGDGTPPVIVDHDPSKPLTAKDGRPYSGCYVNAIVRIYAQDNQYGKRINASLEAIQFLRHGEAFGAAPVDATEKFEVVEDDTDTIGERLEGDNAPSEDDLLGG